MDQTKVVEIKYLDYSKVFDSLTSHSHKMEKREISKFMLEWTHNCLNYYSQRVTTTVAVSGGLEVSTGAPQKSGLCSA